MKFQHTVNWCGNTTVIFFIIKLTRCTNFSNLFWNETACFGQFLCPSSGFIHCTLSIQVCRQLSSRIRLELQIHPDPAAAAAARQLTTNLYAECTGNKS
jgi:hypothetical protein